METKHVYASREDEADGVRYVNPDCDCLFCVEEMAEARELNYGNYGGYQAEAETEDCAYCGRTVLADQPVPAVGDDDGWAALAAQHETGCEWLVTRAHRRTAA